MVDNEDDAVRINDLHVPPEAEGIIGTKQSFAPARYYLLATLITYSGTSSAYPVKPAIARGMMSSSRKPFRAAVAAGKSGKGRRCVLGCSRGYVMVVRGR
jgi:hypothetical protein